jgi:hypothetical protein
VTQVSLGGQHVAGGVGGTEDLVMELQVGRELLGCGPRRVDVPSDAVRFSAACAFRLATASRNSRIAASALSRSVSTVDRSKLTSATESPIMSVITSSCR